MDWINFDEFRRKILEQEKRKAKKNSFVSSLWLANVEKFYNEKNINIGYIRAHNAPPRKKRPGVIINAENGQYKIIFFTTSTGAFPVFDVDRCRHYTCPEPFKWVDKAKIFVEYRKNRKPRKIFTINFKDLEELMVFCGNCDKDYITKIKNKVI